MKGRALERSRGRHGLELPDNLAHETLDVGGLTRDYWVAPLPLAAEPTPPLLVVLHGAGAQGPGTAALTKLHLRGPAAGFVTVFPDGKGRVWNDRRDAGALRQRENVDDVAFLQALVRRFSSDGRARGDGVYLAGISNGALMSEHVGRRGLLAVAGLGLVAGPGTVTSRAETPRPAQPATVVIFAGTADPLVPYGGGPIGPLGRMVQRRSRGASNRGLAVAAEIAAADWAAANGSVGAPMIDVLTVPAGDLPVTRIAWETGAGPTVVLYRIEGGGHTWPGGAQYLPARLIGPVAKRLDATGLLLDRFWRRETAPRDDAA